MQDNNYLTIQGWMINKLELKGAELMTFAAIYGFSQDGDSVFSGTLGYLSDWVGVSKQSMCSILKKLLEKNLIIKIEKNVNGVQFFDYKVNLTTIKEILMPIKETLTETNNTVKETLTPTNIYNNNNNNNIYISQTQKPEKLKRENLQPYGEFQNVMLTKDEVRKLIDKYGFYFQDAIEYLSSYLATKGKDKYKNHYAVMQINGWVWEKVHQNPDCGIRKKVQLVQDANAKGGYREETIAEYYKRVMNIDI